jgi:hypothetical protein
MKLTKFGQAFLNSLLEKSNQLHITFRLFAGGLECAGVSRGKEP